MNPRSVCAQKVPWWPCHKKKHNTPLPSLQEIRYCLHPKDQRKLEVLKQRTNFYVPLHLRSMLHLKWFIRTTNLFLSEMEDEEKGDPTSSEVRVWRDGEWVLFFPGGASLFL